MTLAWALDRRRAGIILHPTSLPQSSLGGDARRFVDFLAAAGQSVWQTLPLAPTHDDGSPYNALSVHAGNPALIDLDELVQAGWIDGATRAGERGAALRAARKGFATSATPAQQRSFSAFRLEQGRWLQDYALFIAVHEEQQHRAWSDWAPGLRDRDEQSLAQVRQRLAEQVDQASFEQFLFYSQWRALRDYANRNGVLLFGDMPIFVAHDSADVWASREYFDLDGNGQPRVVAGVPPDYFSATGQRWGNPLYRWEVMRANGYDWWLARMTTQLELCDLVRIDHFRGFESYWEIPATEPTAIHGEWRPGPGAELFEALTRQFDGLPLVAEDLGIITEEVNRLREAFGIPGMKVLQFAFDGGPDNPYLPQHHVENCVVYTGTHDNDTTLGWFGKLDRDQQRYVVSVTGGSADDMPWPMIETAYRSPARLAMTPMQDVLALGSEHRMNTPGTTAGNWHWRMQWEMVPENLAWRLSRLVDNHRRSA